MVLIVLGGCSGPKVTTKTAPQIQQYRIHKIAVVPFETTSTPQVLQPNSPSMSVPEGVRRSDISVAVPPNTETYPRFTQEVPQAASRIITNLVWTKLKDKPGLEIISPDEVIKSAGKLYRDKDAEPLEAIGKKIATRMDADAALIGTVLVYQERVGSRLGASPPATVGFEMKLVGNDGAVLWEGNYYERQRPMSEDLWGFIQRYGAFVTAEELAAYGSDRLAREFPFGGRIKE
jgi:hypothetical protein